jgi:flagellar biosynthetic protein FliR
MIEKIKLLINAIWTKMNILEEYTVKQVYITMACFCRISSIFMMIPIFGESYFPVRSKILLALITAFILSPAVGEFYQGLPKSTIGLLFIVVTELIFGFFIGLVARVIVSSLHVAGTIFASQSSLSSSMVFDPTNGTQNQVISSFYTLTLTTLLFVLDFHHLVIQGISKSYKYLSPGDLSSFSEINATLIKTMSYAIEIGFKISAPIILISLLINIGGGIFSKLIPGIHIFFLMTPLQILLALGLIFLTLIFVMPWFLEIFTDVISPFLQ